MLRQLLTLLALFTGLAATEVPAHARNAGVENVRLETASAHVQQSTAQARAEFHEPRSALEKREISGPMSCHRAILVAVPTVYIGSDRACE